MADIVVFGQVAADVVLRTATMPLPGEHVTAEGLGWRVGGSAANVACGLSSAGHDVRLVGSIGSDEMGDALVAELHRRGVDTRSMFRLPGPSPRTLVVLDAVGERTMISLEHDVGRFMPANAPDLSSAECVYVESYTRYPVSISESAGSALVIAPPPAEGITSWPADVVVGSASQYRETVLAAPYQSFSAIAGSRLQWIVVTSGSMGADAYGAEDHVHVAAPPVAQVDATGAGDAFTAGLVHGLLTGAGIAAAMDLGVAWGAETVSRLQSLPPTWAELLAAP